MNTLSFRRVWLSWWDRFLLARRPIVFLTNGSVSAACQELRGRYFQIGSWIGEDVGTPTDWWEAYIPNLTAAG